MIDTINAGTLYLRGAPYEYFARKGCKLADSYGAYQGVAFLDLLNTDEG